MDMALKLGFYSFVVVVNTHIFVITDQIMRVCHFGKVDSRKNYIIIAKVYNLPNLQVCLVIKSKYRCVTPNWVDSKLCSYYFHLKINKK